MHEFGHFIGLDHTQINLQYVHDDDTANDIYIPTMFPTSTDDDTPLGDLNPDDKAALTMLYPAEDSIVDAAYGRISGTLHWQSGLPARGANVVAVNIDDEKMSRFSSVSDYCMQGDGSFEMLVTPGTYRFFVEPIYPLFTGGSSVGPYAETALSPSFVFPVIATEYDETLTIAAGETKDRRFCRPAQLAAARAGAVCPPAAVFEQPGASAHCGQLSKAGAPPCRLMFMKCFCRGGSRTAPAAK